MSNESYTLATLQELEEQCQVKASKMGLDVPETLFHLVQAEEMYDIAARGLPGRFSHWRFGRRYQEEKGNYDKGRGRIYELVINTRPVYAYLLDGNSLVAQLLVMAHVLGHATVYEHNAYFQVADKNILSRTRAAAERIDGYMGEYGRQRVEDFIDACQTLEYQRSFGQLGKAYTAKPPKWESKGFDMLFPEETKQRRADYKNEKEEFRTRFPKQPERDFLEFFERHSRHLEDWQRDIISILRMEQEYFTPMIHTNIIHEAQAVYYHQNIVQEIMAEDPERWDLDDFTEFQSMNARVLHPHIRKIVQQDPWSGEHQESIVCTGVNPYLTGSTIYAEVKRICENPTDEEKEKWPDWAGQITWEEKRGELVRSYNDAALLNEFLSPTVCEKARLFLNPRTPEQYEKLQVLEKEVEQVRAELVEQKTTFGVPTVEIVDADYKKRGELYLEHRHTNKGLDPEYTEGVLPHIADLWGHAVTVHTVEQKNHGELDENGEPAEPILEDIWYRIAQAGDESHDVDAFRHQP